jgi:voltage-gated potassium channel Kch
MKIPMPTGSLVSWALVFAAFVVVTRCITTFAPLYLMRQGLRMSIIPAINLSQVSEFSLVVISLGVQAGHIANPSTQGMVALAFTLLAAVSTFGMAKSDGIARGVIPLLKRAGLCDLDGCGDDVHAEGGEGHGSSRIMFLGFFRTASSLLEDMQCHAPDLIKHVAVVDFSPVARAGLIERKVRIVYGDISQRDTLLHAGVESAEVLICTIPDSLLKGTSNERLVRQLRSLNPTAKIISTAEVLTQVPVLMEAGADYVSVARLHEAGDLLAAVRAATKGLIDHKRTELNTILATRREVLE